MLCIILPYPLHWCEDEAFCPQGLFKTGSITVAGWILQKRKWQSVEFLWRKSHIFIRVHWASHASAFADQYSAKAYLSKKEIAHNIICQVCTSQWVQLIFVNILDCCRICALLWRLLGCKKHEPSSDILPQQRPYLNKTPWSSFLRGLERSIGSGWIRELHIITYFALCS